MSVSPTPLRFELLDYRVVRDRLPDGRSHLLLGNGFSIGCDPIFTYQRLYDAAVKAGLSTRAQAVFGHLGTNNFEGVMRLLDDAHWVAGTYGLVHIDRSEMLADVEVVKRTLVQAIAESHLEHTGQVPEEKKTAALAFLKPYHNVFTSNYDLLAYWVDMHAGDDPPYEDGFRADPDEPDAESLVFTERLGDTSGLFYIHGALHLFLQGGQLRKHCWIRTGKRLTELIREGLDRKHYPLFVAEGSPEKKLEQINRSGYLSYCLGKLGRVTNRLVVYGHALGESDRHIVNAIADNLDLSELHVGLYGNPDSPPNLAIRHAVQYITDRRHRANLNRKRPRPLSIAFYDSASARVWG